MFEVLSMDYFPQVLRDKRDKYRTQLRRDRNESFFNDFRLSFLHTPNHSEKSSFTKEELHYFSTNIIQAYDSKDNSLINTIISSFKEVLLIKAITYDNKDFLDSAIYQIINDLIANSCNWVLTPNQLMEDCIYIYILLLQYIPESAEKLVNIEGVSHLLSLTGSSYFQEKLFLIFEALSISCISEFFRDFIIKGDIVRKILDVLLGDLWFTDIRLIESIIELIKMFYVIKPLPSYQDLKFLLEPLIALLGLNDDIANSILFILNRMAASNYEDFVSNSFEIDCFPSILINFLKSNDDNLVESTLNVVAALTFGDAEHNYQMYEKNIIPQIVSLIKSTNVSVSLKKKALIIMGNFFDGDHRHVEVGLDQTYSFFEFINLQMKDKDYEIQREIIHCIVNASFASNSLQIEALVDLNSITKMVEVLIGFECEETLSLIILEGIENFIMAGHLSKEENKFDKKIEELNLKEILNKLLGHYNENVGIASAKILNGYFVV